MQKFNYKLKSSKRFEIHEYLEESKKILSFIVNLKKSQDPKKLSTKQSSYFYGIHVVYVYGKFEAILKSILKDYIDNEITDLKIRKALKEVIEKKSVSYPIAKQHTAQEFLKQNVEFLSSVSFISKNFVEWNDILKLICDLYKQIRCSVVHQFSVPQIVFDDMPFINFILCIFLDKIALELKQTQSHYRQISLEFNDMSFSGLYNHFEKLILAGFDGIF